MATNSKEYMEMYRKEKKDIVAKARKKWQQDNKEYLREYMREYRKRKKLEEKNKRD